MKNIKWNLTLILSIGVLLATFASCASTSSNLREKISESKGRQGLEVYHIDLVGQF